MRILALGDSITVGLARSGQLARVWDGAELLGSLVDPATGARHEGHGGWTVGKVLALVRGGGLEYARATRPTVLLMLGSNDALWILEPRAVARELRQLVELVQAVTGGWVVLATPPPLEATMAGYDARVAAIAWESVVAMRGARRVSLIDGRGTLRGLLADGVHPNAAGYAALARAYRGALWRREGVDAVLGVGAAAAVGELGRRAWGWLGL